MKKSKKLILTLASIATISTVGFTMNSSFSYTASAAKHHKKHHVNKSKSGNSARKYREYKSRLNSDISTYNGIVHDDWAQYSGDAGYQQSGHVYQLINGNSANGDYRVDNDNGNPNYSAGKYTDIANSLNDIVKDMNSNQENPDNDKYLDSRVELLQSDAKSLYSLFRGRFSSSENNTLDKLNSNVIKNNIDDNSNDTYVNNQWNNVRDFLSELSKAVSSLDKY